MISFDNLLWSPCVSQACQWVGICQEWGDVWEGLLSSSQTWFSTSRAGSLSGNREEEPCCSRVWRWRQPWMSCSGTCRSSVLEPLTPFLLPWASLSVLLSSYLETTIWFISSVEPLFRVYRSHFFVCVYGRLIHFSQHIIKIISGSIATCKRKIKSIPAFNKCCQRFSLDQEWCSVCCCL